MHECVHVCMCAEGLAVHTCSNHHSPLSLPLFTYTAPGHQLRQFYRHGNVDDCSSSWKGVWDCLSARTVRYKEDADAAVEVAAVARATHPLWRLRTPEEAACWWKAGFGHLDGAPAEPAPGSHYPPPASGGGLHASGGEATP